MESTIWSLVFWEFPIPLYFHPEVSGKKGVALKPKAALAALGHHATCPRGRKGCLGLSGNSFPALNCRKKRAERETPGKPVTKLYIVDLPIFN